MIIPFLDLASQYKQIKPKAESAFKNLLKRGDFILGEDVKHFEAAFSSFIGAKYALGVNSGTDALFLGLLALGVGPGDEVIVPDFTYIASAFAVSYTGARPVFVDIEQRSFNIDPEKIKRAITKKTKAIMPVHLYGQSARMDEISFLAKHYGLKVIEDAAQAHGADFKGKKTGAIGDIGAFSFYPTKNLGAFGDGGLVATNNAVVFNRLKRLRDYGRKTRYSHVSLGYNSRLDSMQALFLKEKLKYLPEWNEKRIIIAQMYRQLLSGCKGLVLPQEEPYGKHVYHIFACLTKRRDEVIEHLRKKGVAAAVHYPVPLHKQVVYRYLKNKFDDFPVSSKVAKEVFCLPIYPHMTKKQVYFVSDKVKETLAELQQIHF
ncbi:MAG: DegT/DnrJ/EryC1/StrS family aminotransferase [Candidatus Omnitrophota bacterium]